MRYHSDGTMVVIQGPRFSTRAESKWFSSMGWKVINMTGYPEVMLARELDVLPCPWLPDDVGLEGRPDIRPVTAEEVTRVFMEHNEKLKHLMRRIIANIPASAQCSCHEELERVLS